MRKLRKAGEDGENTENNISCNRERPMLRQIELMHSFRRNLLTRKCMRGIVD